MKTDMDYDDPNYDYSAPLRLHGCYQCGRIVRTASKLALVCRGCGAQMELAST
jgi:hypothetical protein